jgi:hypothetical protein
MRHETTEKNTRLPFARFRPRPRCGLPGGRVHWKFRVAGRARLLGPMHFSGFFLSLCVSWKYSNTRLSNNPIMILESQYLA